jgi:hypothetical protein
LLKVILFLYSLNTSLQAYDFPNGRQQMGKTSAPPHTALAQSSDEINSF